MSKEAMKMARQIIWRYRHETPLGNQPYMIAHEADEAIERIDQALAKQEQGEPVAWINWCAATGKRSVSFDCESELASQPLYFGTTRNTQNRYSNQNSLAYERLELVGHADLAINNIYIFSGYGEDVPEGRTAIYAGYKTAKAMKENT